MSVRFAEDFRPAQAYLIHDVGADQMQFLLGNYVHRPGRPNRDGRIGFQMMLHLRVFQRMGGERNHIR